MLGVYTGPRQESWTLPLCSRALIDIMVINNDMGGYGGDMVGYGGIWGGDGWIWVDLGPMGPRGPMGPISPHIQP